jgi:hypothetical protein
MGFSLLYAEYTGNQADSFITMLTGLLVPAYEVGMLRHDRSYLCLSGCQRWVLSWGCDGARPVNDAPFTAGAYLFAPRDALRRKNDHGYVTSVCYAPTLAAIWGGIFAGRTGAPRAD